MKKRFKSLNFLMVLSLVVATAVMTSCEKNDNPTPEPEAKAGLIEATEYDSWSYFNFKDGKATKLDIAKKEGAVTGLYKGNFSYSLMGMSGNQEDVALVISQRGKDSVKIKVSKLNLSMSGGNSFVDLTAVSLATKEGDKWVLSSDKSTSNLVDPDGDGTSKDYKLKVTGEIGTTKGSDVNLSLAITPGAMPMSIPGVYASKVENSYIYEVDGEGAFDWDIALHMYDMRTNGGSVAKVTAATLDAITSIPAETEFKTDEDGSVISDLSLMMQGAIGYHYTTINPVLYDWVKRTPTGSMPPVLYELNAADAFVVKTKDGSYVKVKFSDFTNDKGEDVYASFTYEFME